MRRASGKNLDTALSVATSAPLVGICGDPEFLKILDSSGNGRIIHSEIAAMIVFSIIVADIIR